MILISHLKCDVWLIVRNFEFPAKFKHNISAERL